MSSIELLQSQKNELLQHIKTAHMNPSDFTWQEVESSFEEGEFGFARRVSCLVYRNARFYYTFDLKGGKHYAIFSPGKEFTREQQYPGSWAWQLKYFKDWLSCVAREVREQDLWAAFAEEAGTLMSSSPMALEEGSFTPVERSSLTEKLSEIAERVDSISGTSEVIKEQTVYLKGALHKQSKRDWFFLFVGVLVTVGSTLALSPEEGNAIVAYLKAVIGQVLQMLRPSG